MSTGGDGPCASEKMLPRVSQCCRKRSFQFSFVGPGGSVCLWGNITAAASQCVKLLGRAAVFSPLLAANPVCEHLDLLWISLGQEMCRERAARGEADVWT